MYFRNEKPRLFGCSYPKTLNMKLSLVMNVSPSVGTQFFGITVLKHLNENLAETIKKHTAQTSAIFKVAKINTFDSDLK